MKYFPAEWHPQQAVMLTWPHRNTDWSENFDDVILVYREIASNILEYQDLIISCEDSAELEKATRCLSPIAEKHGYNLSTYLVPADDTWARDHGPISIFDSGQLTLLDFTFNAWGGKFEASKDNLITQNLHQQGAFGDVNRQSIDFILEGGSIESDGKGTLLTTEQCLLTDTRNQHSSKEDIENYLGSQLGIKRLIWLKHGYIQGDDTDSHIDTLVRFCSEDTIAYVQCVDSDDIHYDELSAMENELKLIRTTEDEPYKLIPLPLPKVFDEKGRRLGATYANFLIINDAVLLPVYGVSEDETATNRLKDCFPDREVIAINCLPLIHQNGSLHCITMQIPKDIGIS